MVHKNDSMKIETIDRNIHIGLHDKFKPSAYRGSRSPLVVSVENDKHYDTATVRVITKITIASTNNLIKLLFKYNYLN